jgi:hypothetical protein
VGVVWRCYLPYVVCSVSKDIKVLVGCWVLFSRHFAVHSFLLPFRIVAVTNRQFVEISTELVCLTSQAEGRFPRTDNQLKSVSKQRWTGTPLKSDTNVWLTF